MENILEAGATTTEKVVAPIYGRFKGADWFDALYKKDLMVLGQGGIGSWLTLLLSRTGANLFTYDMDNFESHNGGQVMRIADVGKPKTQAVKELVREFSPDCEVKTHGKYVADSLTNDIVLCGFDNMAARKQAFVNWKSNIEEFVKPEERKNYFFQDGRLLAEQLQIFNIRGDNKEKMELYEKEFLFSDDEVPSEDCTFKQTTHCAAMIASHMIGFLCNWISNRDSDTPYKQVPFFYEYSIPLNLTSIE